MGFHASTGGGASAAVVARRVSPCFALSKSSIPYVLWGEDSLCFAFDVPTILFATVNILVPTGRLADACSAITRHLPYEVSPVRCHRLSSSNRAAFFRECLRLDTPELSFYNPEHVLLIEDGLLHFDTTDPRCVQRHRLEPFPPVNEGDFVNVPTLAAYFDSLMLTQRIRCSSPQPVGWWDWLMGRRPVEEEEQLQNRQECLRSHVAISLSYLTLYTFKKKGRMYPDVESIDQSIQNVAAMLKEENREEFLHQFIGVDPPPGDDPWERMIESSDSEGDDAGGGQSGIECDDGEASGMGAEREESRAKE
ncbi:hypothetical protein BDD12DRAFT_802327 [Trichophaea hybrida]|nr:hypothetical protein BDD12DRAFT_802327 [Trichophaea hybrida]